jgi:hypothetical protein
MFKKYLRHVYQNYADETIKVEISHPENLCCIE